jgi:hypothetical protein
LSRDDEIPQTNPSEPATVRRTAPPESADQLREQAAACRRLAHQARTRAGTKALDALGDHLDDRAGKLDPSSQRR